MNLTKYFAAATVVGSVLAGTALAQEAAPVEPEAAKVGAYAGTVVKNGYISNGTLIYDDAVLQSYAGITYLGFDFNFWNSLGLEDSHYAKSDASEIDWELDYGFEVGDFDFMLGVATWTYPNTDNWDDEWVGKVAVGYNGCEYVRPELNARFGLESQQGCYGQFKLSKGFELEKGLALDIYGLIAYASKSWRAGKGDDDDGFADAEFGAKLTYEFCDNASINVGCQYAVIADGTLRDCVDSGDYWQADGDADHFMYFAGVDVWF